MHDRPLQNPLQADGLLRDFYIDFRQRLKVFFKIGLQGFLERFQIPAAVDDNLLAVIFEQQCIQQMFRRQVFVMPALCLANSEGECQLYVLAKHLAPLHLLEGAFQRKPLTLGPDMHLVDLGLGDIKRISTADTKPGHVNLQHNPVGFGRRQVKYRLQNTDDEVHCRVVVIMHENLVHRRQSRPAEYFRFCRTVNLR